MKFKFKKSFKEDEIVELEVDSVVNKPNNRLRMLGMVPDFLEEVKEPEYRYCDTGNVIQPKGNWYTSYTIDELAVAKECSFQTGSDMETKFLKNLVNVGNCFETIEGAEKHLAFLKAHATLKRFMMEKSVKNTWNNDYENKRTFYWNHTKQELRCTNWGEQQHTEFWFNKIEDAEECIKLYTPELKIVLGVE